MKKKRDNKGKENKIKGRRVPEVRGGETFCSKGPESGDLGSAGPHLAMILEKINIFSGSHFSFPLL